MPGLKLYSVSDSPPTLAVRMLLAALDLPHELVDVDFAAGEHLTESYAQINPQKEVPCIDDNGFLLSESVAILQYLADRYGKNEDLYPRDPQKRAVVNHRLVFNLSTYYQYISEYVMAPIFYAYERTALGLKKTNIGLSVFNTILERNATKFAAGDEMTIADLALVAATMCLEAINFDVSPYPRVARWYADFKGDFPSLWRVAERGMKEIRQFDRDPPDLSGLNHPIHPTSKKRTNH
ncbi:glutathione S-transferase 1 [Bacillus rossius redtenbacheri]|uniref:glutathione S-transferase 1 n=1 Tax=Bacillus rossius redtenbacheri TaxID=93214 RepID=UPI002FDCAA1B